MKVSLGAPLASEIHQWVTSAEQRWVNLGKRLSLDWLYLWSSCKKRPWCASQRVRPDRSAYGRAHLRVCAATTTSQEGLRFDEEAATAFNRCRERGIQGSNTDFLICAAAMRRKLAIYTTDGDFPQYAKVLKLDLHKPRV